MLLSCLNARLVLAGRDESRLGQTFAALSGTGHTTEVFDFAATDQIVDWVKKITGQVGPLHGFVHSAGKQLVAPIRTLTPAAMEEQMRVNLYSAMMLARGFCQKGCSVKGGSLVFVSSIMANVGKPGLSAYCASKAALVGLTRSLALEFTRDKVRVNCITPSIIETELTPENMKELMLLEQWKALEDQHPLGFGAPRDVANAAAFLLADTGRWITERLWW